MKNSRFISTLTLVLIAVPVLAADIAPGLWEIKLESRVPGEATWEPSPFNLTQCLTVSDAKDPSRLVSSIAVPGATDCTYTDKSYAGGNFRFTLDCSGSFGLKVKGSVDFSANAFSGTMTATGTILGAKPTEFQNKVSGKRLKDC